MLWGRRGRGLEEKWPYTVVAGPDDREEVEHAPELLLVHGGWVGGCARDVSGNPRLAGLVPNSPERERERERDASSLGLKTRNSA